MGMHVEVLMVLRRYWPADKKGLEKSLIERIIAAWSRMRGMHGMHGPHERQIDWQEAKSKTSNFIEHWYLEKYPRLVLKYAPFELSDDEKDEFNALFKYHR